MPFLWARDVIINNKKITLQILLGEKFIGDKYYYRIGNGHRKWFRIEDVPVVDINRDLIVKRGLELIKKELGDTPVYKENGEPFEWEEV